MSTDVSKVRTASVIRAMRPVHLDYYITSYLFPQGSLIALMMEVVRTSETSVNIYLTTRQYLPEDSKLQLGIKLDFLVMATVPSFSFISP
jgi:hypothetical protein